MDARKRSYKPADLEELFEGATRLVAMKGKKVETFVLAGGSPDPVLLKAVLGPSGNLRAPAIRKGKTWLVGFNSEGYEAAFG